jgi:hypothetical protein
MIDIKKVREALDDIKIDAISHCRNYDYANPYCEETVNTNALELEQVINELDRLQKFKKTFDAYELSKKQGFIAYENWQECEKELKAYKDEVDELMALVIGDYDMSRLKEDMKDLEGDDLQIAQLIIKLSRSEEE